MEDATKGNGLVKSYSMKNMYGFQKQEGFFGEVEEL